jgi:hypothetical protein
VLSIRTVAPRSSFSCLALANNARLTASGWCGLGFGFNGLHPQHTDAANADFQGKT